MKLGGAQLREMRRESFRATAALIAAAARRAGRAGGGLSGLFGAEAAGALTAALQGIPVQEVPIPAPPTVRGRLKLWGGRVQDGRECGCVSDDVGGGGQLDPQSKEALSALEKSVAELP
eukprot:136874-Rhodomonas_salina.4